jgi:type IV pilus assembly protein PilY1
VSILRGIKLDVVRAAWFVGCKSFWLLLVIFFGVFSSSNVSADPLQLSTSLASSGGKDPAPNVIVSIDNSTSMTWAVDSDVAPVNGAPRRIDVLVNAIRKTFGDGRANSGKIPDNSIRLAFQAMHGGGTWPLGGVIVKDNLVLGAVNSMQPFSGVDEKCRALFELTEASL